MTKSDAIELAIFYKKTTGKAQVIYNTHSQAGYFVNHDNNCKSATIYKIF